MASLLQLLAMREGTPQAIKSALVAGAPIDEVHPRTKEGVLHVLFRRCTCPLELFDTVKVLVEHGADVNLLDYRGATPLSLLVLHVNHGLRYHSYPLPQIQHLEGLATPKLQIQKLMVQLDAQYQEQVYQSLELMLSAGADVNAIPDVTPAIPASAEWVEAYEHKLMQQEGRWHLLGYDTSMEFSTYNIFNPVSSHRCINEQKLTPLHLVAWRGDARCIRLLLEHGANAKAVTDENTSVSKETTNLNNLSTFRPKGRMVSNSTNSRQKKGRGALHFLYLYCNKPGDLVKATRALLAAGADPDVLHHGESPAHLLIPHVLIKRTYHQYLSNTYILEELNREPKNDHYLDELATCLQLLTEATPATPPTRLQAIANVKYNSGLSWDGLLLKLFRQFEHMLINTDKCFQPLGHYLVPYTFKVDALTEFAGIFIKHGCKVNITDTEGQTPLHHLVSSIQNLSTDPNLNTREAICRCFHVLLDAGADSNKKDIYQKTPLFATVLLGLEAIGAMESYGFELISAILDLMTRYGGDLNVRDCLNFTPLVRTVMSVKRPLRCRATRKVGVNLKKFLESLLMNGADPNVCYIPNDGAEEHSSFYHHPYPLDLLFDFHFDLQLHEAEPSPDCLLSNAIAMVTGCMNQRGIRQVVERLLAKQYPDVEDTHPPPEQDQSIEVHSSRCADCSLVLQLSHEAFSLKLTCRRALIKAMKGRYKSDVQQLPLPAEIKRYLLDLTVL